MRWAGDPESNPHRNQQGNQQARVAAASAREPPERPTIIAGSEAEADDDQVRRGGVAVDAVSAGKSLDAHLTGPEQPTPGPTRAGLADADGGAAASRILNRPQVRTGRVS